ETQYSVRAFPLGGFVSVAGMDEIADEEKGEVVPLERRYTSKPAWAKIATIAAGPLMNIVFAIVVSAIIVGVSGRLIPIVGKPMPGSSAEMVGLKGGDEIWAVDNLPIYNQGQFIQLIASSQDESIKLKVKREHEFLEFVVTPKFYEELGRPIIGVDELTYKEVPLGFFGVIKGGWDNTRIMVVTLFRGLRAMITGKVEADVAGPVGMVQMIGETASVMEEDFLIGLLNVLYLAVFLSVNFAILNLLPVPVLDGGWILLILIELIRGKPLTEKQKAIAQMTGLAFIAGLFLFATYSDFSRLGWLDNILEK
ncbi:MAG TPA: site-2 protease family protein, partial [Firmicutes bacterium]|nr:site-2 protease family protein [Bacillota bacterium]